MNGSSLRGTDGLTLVLAAMMGMGAVYGMVGILLVAGTVFLDGYVPTFAGQLTVVSAVLLAIPIGLKRLRFADLG